MNWMQMCEFWLFFLNKKKDVYWPDGHKSILIIDFKWQQISREIVKLKRWYENPIILYIHSQLHKKKPINLLK